jgi:hypothetical protein
MSIDPHAATERGLAPEVFEDLRIGGDLEQADGVETGGEAGLLLEGRVEIARVLGDLHARTRRETGSHDETGGVPGRPGRQLVALEQHDVGPAALGQMVRDAASDDAAADDDHARRARDGRGLSLG